MTHGSLFSGIGGFDLGFQRAGIKTIWQVELDEYCRRVLARHFPATKRYTDIRDVLADSEQQRRERRQGNQEGSIADGNATERAKGSDGLGSKGETGESLEPVDIISGGFPCQPVSCAGKRKGKADARWLWPEMLRVISVLRPSWVVAENVYGLISHEGGELLDTVYADLEGEGYETLPPIVIPACAVGAPHQRNRVWIVAHDQREPAERRSNGTERRQRSTEEGARDGGSGRGAVNDRWAVECRLGIASHGLPENMDCGGWECGVPRTTRKQPNRVDRLRSLGNSIVPQIAELIGNMIQTLKEKEQD